MHKCVRVSIQVEEQKIGKVSAIVEQAAREAAVEGALHVCPPTSLELIACGSKEMVDSFLDLFHEYQQGIDLLHFSIEAALKDRDYRGTFRVIH